MHLKMNTHDYWKWYLNGVDIKGSWYPKRPIPWDKSNTFHTHVWDNGIYHITMHYYLKKE